MIQIDQGIMYPPRRHAFPFANMKIGDSFLVPHQLSRATITAACARASKEFKMKFSVRAIGKGDFRCWRIS